MVSQPNGRLLLAAIVVSLAIAAGTWFRDGQQIGALRHDVEALRASVAQISTSSGGTVLNIANVPALGSADAVVALVEFSDYECPFCIRHFQQTMPRIDAEYIKTGKIRYVFQDFPIDQNHPEAIHAHVAAHCALEQHKYWDLHVRLFSKPGTHTPELIGAQATQAGISLAAFHECIASGRPTSTIRQSAAVAAKLGADGTPAFFIGVRDPSKETVRVLHTLMGAQPFEEFQKAFDEVRK